MEYSLSRRLAAWGVHFYTALGIPLAFVCLHAMHVGNPRAFFLAQTVACWIDATDGWLARKVDVKAVVPGFSGRRLDDIVDYIHFVLLPLLALPAFNIIPEAWAPIIILPLMASAYGFCQEFAKTEDSFVGFPSYWNILTLYLYVMAATPMTTIVSLVVLSALVFLPIHYIYPSKTKRLQVWTVGLGLIWTAMVVFISLRPDSALAARVALVSLYYPAWYLFVSALHHQDVKAREALGEAPVAGA